VCNVGEEGFLIAIVHGRNVIIDSTMQIAAAGDRALLATFDRITAADLRARAAAVRADPRVVACVVGHSSLLAVFHDAPQREVFDVAGESIESAPRVHDVDVTFDGADLDEFLATARITRDELLARIGSITLVARYLGFRAGFAYLDGWPREWRMPRRATSRTRVPRGSFAIAGELAGFYPIDSPGGWNLLGHTDAELWDASREPPNLIAPGDEVRIHAR
jgi:KipI family sensor histidine kinase inhibitor